MAPAMVTRFGCGVVWARAQSCAEKGESFSIERREKSAKPIEINVRTIKNFEGKGIREYATFSGTFPSAPQAVKWKDHE
jgi:hypothetical protein